MNQDPQKRVFPISKIKDIFELPTIEQMETCLDELKQALMQARRSHDGLVAFAKTLGHPVDQAFEWPDPVDWVDDGKGEVKTRYLSPDGELLFSVCNQEAKGGTR